MQHPPRSFWRAAAYAAVLALGTFGVLAQQPPGDPLLRGFQNPPDSAKPRVWWHWMSGNVTKEGIKADLEWMKRSGIGGFQNFDAGLNTPQIVEKRLVFMTPEWKDAFRYAATLADKLGLEMAIAGSPGWSESGGPWVTPTQAMKKYVWSETRVEGGKPFTGTLPKPPVRDRRRIRTRRADEAGSAGRPRAPAPPPEFYADAAVVAYRAPEGDRPMSALQPKVTASGGTFDVAALTDGDVAKATLLPAAPVNERAWIQYRVPAAADHPRPHASSPAAAAAAASAAAAPSPRSSRRATTASSSATVTPIAAARDAGLRPGDRAASSAISILTPAPQPAQNRGGTRRLRRRRSGGGQRGADARAPAGTQIAEFVLHTRRRQPVPGEGRRSRRRRASTRWPRRPCRRPRRCARRTSSISPRR